jgi:hypothetical protein
MDVMRLVLKLFALLVVAGLGLGPDHFSTDAQSEKKKEQPVFDEVAEKGG